MRPKRQKTERIMALTILMSIALLIVVLPFALPRCGVDGFHLPHFEGTPSMDHVTGPCASAHAGDHTALLDMAYMINTDVGASTPALLSVMSIIAFVGVVLLTLIYSSHVQLADGYARFWWRTVTIPIVDPLRRALAQGILQRKTLDASQ